MQSFETNLLTDQGREFSCKIEFLEVGPKKLIVVSNIFVNGSTAISPTWLAICTNEKMRDMAEKEIVTYLANQIEDAR